MAAGFQSSGATTCTSSEVVTTTAFDPQARGARWLVLAQITRALLLFVGVTVLSRLLTPTEFGYVAVAVAIVGVGEILRDMGLSAAAITRPDLSIGERSVLFWADVMLGLFLAMILVMSAPSIGALFDSSVLDDVLRVMSVVFVLNGVGAQYRAELNRTLRFASLAVVDTVGPLSGIVAAVILAVAGAGFWALAFQIIVASGVSTIVLVALGRWRPGLPREWRSSLPLLSFGIRVAGAQILGYLGTNVDTFVLGYSSSPAQVGFYNRAFQVGAQSIALLRDPATAIALPNLSRAVGDNLRLERAAIAGQRVLAFTVVPVGGLLATTAFLIVPLALGETWVSIAPVVSVLAVASAIQALASVSSWLFLARGMGGALVAYSAISLAVKSAFIVALVEYGALGVAWGYLGAVAVMWPIASIWACGRTGISVVALARAGAVPIVLAGLGTAAGIVVSILLNASQLLSAIATTFAFFTPYMLGFCSRRIRREYSRTLRVIRGAKIED